MKVAAKSEWIFGKRSVEEALRSGRKVEKIYLAEGIQKKKIESVIQQAKKQKIPFSWVPRSRLSQLSRQENHQGMIAQIAAYEYATLSDCFRLAEKKQEPPRPRGVSTV